MNAVIEMKPGIVPTAGRLSVTEVTQHAIAVQEVMKAVMKPNVHYGVIPGTKQPTLYKAGAELLCMTFRIADEYRIDEIHSADAVRYRVTCVGRHQVTGVELGSGMGECSTSEEKYRWRKAVCKEEFDATPASLRRVKYAKGRDGFYTADQVRTEPADLANTVLKMACKRAKMAMVLNVTAASDCFSQDLEDLDDVLREHLTDQPQATKPAAPEPIGPYPQAGFEKNLSTWRALIAEGKKTADQIIAAVQTKGTLTLEQIASIKAPEPAKTDEPPFETVAPAVLEGLRAKAAAAAISDADICKHLGIEKLEQMTVAQAEKALAFLNDPVGAA